MNTSLGAGINAKKGRNFPKWLAGGLLVVAAGVVLYGVIVGEDDDGIPLYLDDVSETVVEANGECTWVIEATLRNDWTEDVVVSMVKTVKDRHSSLFRFERFPVVPAGGTAPLKITSRANADGPCITADQVVHADLEVGFDPGQRPSLDGPYLWVTVPF